MPHISSKLSETPHPDTTLLKLSTPFTKNVTTNARQDGNSLLPVTTDQFTLHERNPPPSPVQYVVSESSDGGRIPAIIIAVMPQNSSRKTSYRIRDAYGWIYSTTTMLLLEPTQEKLQAYHNHIEAEEHAADSDTATTAVYAPIVRFHSSAMIAQDPVITTINATIHNAEAALHKDISTLYT